MSFFKFAGAALLAVTVACVAPSATEDGATESATPETSAAQQDVQAPSSSSAVVVPQDDAPCGYECTTSPPLIELSFASCSRICQGGAANCIPVPPGPFGCP